MVAQADNVFDAERSDIVEHRFERGQVPMHVGNRSKSHDLSPALRPPLFALTRWPINGGSSSFTLPARTTNAARLLNPLCGDDCGFI